MTDESSDGSMCAAASRPTAIGILWRRDASAPTGDTLKRNAQPDMEGVEKEVLS
ncbi:MAG: hypothetical protein LLG44_02840 [Chloroflexi bacterium]|nr:hypothetical protein [Chloroflexota bacterium]